MHDPILIALLATFAALLVRPALEIYRSVRRRRAARAPVPYELVIVERVGTIRREADGTYVRLTSVDDRGGRARVVAGTALLRGQRSCASSQVFSSTNNGKGGRTERHFRRT